MRRTPVLLTLGVIATAPTVVYYSSLVTNDSMGILCGSLAALVGAAAFIRHKAYTKTAVALGVGVALVKTSCALPAGVVGLVLLALPIHSWWQRRRSAEPTGDSRHLAKTGLGLIAGATIGTLAWIVYYRATATIEPKTLPTFDVMRIDNMTPSIILQQARSFLGVLTDSYTPFGVWNGEIFSLVGFFATLAIVAGLAGGTFSSPRQWWSVAGPIVLACLYLGGVVIGVGIWRAYDINPGVSARYALPMLPLIALIIPAGIQRRGGRVIYGAGCLVLAVTNVWMISHVSLA
jgi:hypothetical protein